MRQLHNHDQKIIMNMKSYLNVIFCYISDTLDRNRNPASGDYTLIETSPAWILGINEIDTSVIGVQEKLRYSVP